MRIVFFITGCVFCSLGVAGTVLPVLPTTPFMLIALWAFAKSSQRLHDWLLNHALFGSPLQQWQKYRVIPLKAKLTAVAMMTGSFAYLILFSDTPSHLVIGAGVLMAFGACYILTRPSTVSSALASDGNC